jgi:simple sugar transport system ATP-binding protein
LNRKELGRQIREAAEKIGLHADPDVKVRSLSIGERQRVEILKVLLAGAKLVILDEPTSALAPQEVDALFDGLRMLRDDGFSVVIITHKLNETRAIADRVTVLRGGRQILDNVELTSIDNPDLIEAMVGKKVPSLPTVAHTPRTDVPPALDLQGVTLQHGKDEALLRDITMQVRPGELVGIAGISGNGQRELFEVALGLVQPTTGTVAIGSYAPGRMTPIGAAEHGAVNVPEDPVEDAVVPGLTVLETLALADLPAYRKGLSIDWGKVRADYDERDTHTQLSVARPERVVALLSGGNIQRVMLVRALGAEADLVVAAYPARGLDIASTRRTQELLLHQCDQGAGVLLISEDLDELLELSDRLIVLHHGEIAGEVDPRTADRYEIGQLMLNGHVDPTSETAA